MAERTVRTTCNRDCPDACGIVATVDDGRVTRLAGDPDHPVTRGFLCYRTNRFLERQYDPDRLTTPLVRRGGDLVEATWDEALDRVASKLLEIRETSGPEAILYYRSGGSLGVVKHVTDAFFERFGPTSIKSGDICSGAGEAAQELDFGVSDSSDLFDLRNSRTIVLWGKNTHTSSVHLVPLLKEIRAGGGRIVQIDPVRHRGGDDCDLVLQPRPGGDIALALAVARGLFERGAWDRDAPTYCDHFDAFRALAMRRTTRELAAIADVGVDEIESLVDLYADGPSAILVGWGMQRRTHGSATVRVLDALGAISGNLGVPGGGVSFYFARRAAFDWSFMAGDAAAPRRIPEARLGPEVLRASDPPIRAVWVTMGNPVAMLPESESVRRALESREMTVVVDAFLTDTARAAHVVLPCATMLEDDDLLGAYGHHYLGEVRPVVPPPAGVKTDLDIVRALAPRVGLAREFSADARTWKARLWSGIERRGVPLETLSGGPVRRPDAPRVLFEDRRFPTRSGNVNLVTEVEVVPPMPTADRPLLLAALSTPKSQGSQWSARAQEGPATVTVHPDAAPGFVPGERVRLSSEIGAIEVVLAFDDRQRRDLALMDKGGWKSRGRCANVLVSARETDRGGGAVYYDTPVRIGPIDASGPGERVDSVRLGEDARTRAPSSV